MDNFYRLSFRIINNKRGWVMSRLSKLGPIARAVGVIGATAGLVTGVTFAALTSNTVALTPNNISVASASL